MCGFIWQSCCGQCASSPAEAARWGGVYLLTAVIFTVAVLTHHLFCCMLFPVALALFVMDSISGQGVDYRRMIAYGSICLWLVMVLGAIMIFGTMNIDAQTLYQQICDRTVLGVFRRDLHVFQVVFFTDTIGNIQYQLDAGNLQTRWIAFLPSLIYLSPVLAFFLYPWFSAAHHAGTSLARLRYTLAISLFLLVMLPMFAIATDYSRWFFALFFGLMLLAAVAIGQCDEGLVLAWKRLFAWMRRHPFIVAFLLLYVMHLQDGGPYVMPEVRNLVAHFGIEIHC